MSPAAPLASSGYHEAASTVSAVVVVLLIALLVQLEIVRAYRPRARARRRVLYVAIVPLLIAFAFIVGAKLAPLAHR